MKSGCWKLRLSLGVCLKVSQGVGRSGSLSVSGVGAAVVLELVEQGGRSPVDMHKKAEVVCRLTRSRKPSHLLIVRTMRSKKLQGVGDVRYDGHCISPDPAEGRTSCDLAIKHGKARVARSPPVPLFGKVGGRPQLTDIQ